MSKNVQKWDVWLFSFWLGFCLCDAENIRYMSLFFSFNRYNSKHISESFLADRGDRSSLGPWSERKWSLLCCRAHNSKCVGSDAAGAQEWVRWYTAPQFLICKESLNDFPLQLTQLIRKACGRNLNCGITVGITMRQSCQLCWEPGSPSLPAAAATITTVENVHGGMMSLCRFRTKTDKLLLFLFLKAEFRN